MLSQNSQYILITFLVKTSLYMFFKRVHFSVPMYLEILVTTPWQFIDGTDVVMYWMLLSLWKDHFVLVKIIRSKLYLRNDGGTVLRAMADLCDRSLSEGVAVNVVLGLQTLKTASI